MGNPQYHIGRKKEIMKDTIENCTQALVEAIRNSDEYKEFEENKVRMKEHPELRAQMDEFRKKMYLLQNSDSSIDLLEEMSSLFKERQELYKNPLIADYLASEIHMCRIIQRVSMEIFGLANVEIEAFENLISF